MSHITRRVSRLESASGAGAGSEPRQVVRIIAGRNETEDAALQRYRVEHPDVPENTLFIVRVLVSTQHGEATP